MTLTLTNSEMAAFQRCRRGWWLTYYRRLRRIHDYAPLPTVGNLYHMGLEKYYNEDLDDPATFIRLEGESLMAEYPDLTADIRKDVEQAAIMLEGYPLWVEQTGADVGLRVVAAEQAVQVPVGPYILQGKIDTRLEREVDGAWLQLEHKTVGDFTRIPKYAQSAPQFLTYDLLAFLLAREEGQGRATDGLIINMAKRSKQTVKAKPPFYKRHEVRHNVNELRSHYRHVVSIGNQISEVRELLDRGADHHDICPPTVGESHTYSCRCAPITTMFDDGSDVEAFLAELYEEHDPNERYAQKEET